jgi:D-aminopeptidase
MRKLNALLWVTIIHSATFAQTSVKPPRARTLGIAFDGTPGPYNAITDVKDVLVGTTTIIKDSAVTATGSGPVRTGVTVIFPGGKTNNPVPAAWFSLNGDGEMTGLASIEDYGFNYGAIGITNTNSVGVVRDAIGEWNVKRFARRRAVDFSFGLPVVAETWDGLLNDVQGLHVKKEHVFAAMDSACSCPVPEGNAGGGTGMVLFEFKGGNGTASRMIKIDTAIYTLGVLVQANFGRREELTITGVPVGKEIGNLQPQIKELGKKDGSIIVIIATDAPLMPLQLKQVAKRASMGLARTGSIAHNGSGDIFLAFSTRMPEGNDKGTLVTWQVLPKSLMDQLYEATIQATEEAIINALVAGQTMTGINGNTVYRLPHDRLKKVMSKYGRLKGKKRKGLFG